MLKERTTKLVAPRRNRFQTQKRYQTHPKNAVSPRVECGTITRKLALWARASSFITPSPQFFIYKMSIKPGCPHRIKQVPICIQDTVQMWLFSSPPIQSQAQILPPYRDLPLLPHLGQNPLFYEDTVGNRKVSSSASRLRAGRRSLKSLHETEFGCDSFIIIIIILAFSSAFSMLLTCHSSFLGESPQPCLPYMEKVSAYAQFDEITPHSL